MPLTEIDICGAANTSWVGKNSCELYQSYLVLHTQTYSLTVKPGSQDTYKLPT